MNFNPMELHMAATQISFAAFAQSACTPPVIAQAAAPVVAHGPSGDDSGECIPSSEQAQGTIFVPGSLRKSWVVTVEFTTGFRAGEIYRFRFYKRADALRCKRDFVWPGATGKVSLCECWGRNTFDGWVDA